MWTCVWIHKAHMCMGLYPCMYTGMVLCRVCTLRSLELSHVQELVAHTNVWVWLYRSIGASEVGQHRHSPTGEAKTAAGTLLEVPLWAQGLPSTDLSAPLCSRLPSLSDPLLCTGIHVSSQSDLVSTHQKKCKETNKTPIPSLSFPISYFSPGTIKIFLPRF